MMVNRLEATVAIALALIVALTAEPAVAQDEEGKASNLTVLGGIELCGDYDAAIEYLAPSDKKERKRFDKMIEKRKVDANGTTNVFVYSLPVNAAVDGVRPRALGIQEWGGEVLMVNIFYTVPDRDREFFHRAVRTFASSKGEPDKTTPTGAVWVEGEKMTVVVWNIRDDLLTVSLQCVPLMQSLDEREKTSDKNLVEGVF